jgi:deoxyribonuclease-4
MWRSAPPKPEEVREMKRLRAEHDLTPLVVHTAYLVNLASPDEAVRAKSIEAFRGELERAAAIGAEYLVMHPGSGKDRPAEWAMETLAGSLGQAAAAVNAGGVTLLFENTAGAGATLGRSLEELKAIRELAQARVSFPVAYCLDTCHLYASGYDVASEAGLRETVKKAQAVLGLENVPVIHVNDSAGAFNSRLDRHANIGEGWIGREGFRRILNHPKLRGKAFVLETPIDNEGDDQRNVDALKSLCRKSSTTIRRSR